MEELGLSNGRVRSGSGPNIGLGRVKTPKSLEPPPGYSGAGWAGHGRVRSGFSVCSQRSKIKEKMKD